MAKEKDLSIETLRGAAIILVVAGFIVRHDITPEAYPSLAGTLLRLADAALSYIRLPLFTVISSYLYAVSVARRQTLAKLYKGKTRRILVPFLTFSTLQFLLFSFLPGSGDHLNEFFSIYLWPRHQLWFLFSVFNIFLIVGFLDACHAMETPARWKAVLAVSMVLHVLFEMTHAFSLWGVNYLMPFFLLGYGLRRFPQEFFSKPRIYWLMAIAAVSFSLKPVLYAVFDVTLEPLYYKSLGLVVASSVVPLLFYFRRPVPALAYLGYYAFGIHLFHRVTAAGMRLWLEPLGIHNALAVFFVYLAGAIFLALVMQFVFEKTQITRTLILGMKKPSARIVPDYPNLPSEKHVHV